MPPDVLAKSGGHGQRETPRDGGQGGEGPPERQQNSPRSGAHGLGDPGCTGHSGPCLGGENRISPEGPRRDPPVPSWWLIWDGCLLQHLRA